MLLSCGGVSLLLSDWSGGWLACSCLNAVYIFCFLASYLDHRSGLGCQSAWRSRRECGQSVGHRPSSIPFPQSIIRDA